MDTGTPYITCPDCKKNFKGYIPKGGDGSALRIRRHYQLPKYRAQRFEARKVCPGSYRIYDWDGKGA